MDEVNDTGNAAVADRKKALLLKAYEYVSEEDLYGAQEWYATLPPYDLQMLSSGVGDLLYASAHIIAALRGAVVQTTPQLREALDLIKPLLNIPINVKD